MPPPSNPYTGRHTIKNQGQGLEIDIAQAVAPTRHLDSVRTQGHVCHRSTDHLLPALSPGLCAAPFLPETPWVAAARGAIFIHVDEQGG